jgi:hypothetical protein
VRKRDDIHGLARGDACFHRANRAEFRGYLVARVAPERFDDLFGDRLRGAGAEYT